MTQRNVKVKLGLISEIKLLGAAFGLRDDDAFAEKFTQFYPDRRVVDNWPRYTEAQKNKLRRGFVALFAQVLQGGAK